MLLSYKQDVSFCFLVGFTPLIYKFLGDEVAVFFNGPSENLRKIISIKNEALISFQKGNIEEAINMLKEALQNLDVVRVNSNFKNRLKKLGWVL